MRDLFAIPSPKRYHRDMPPQKNRLKRYEFNLLFKNGRRFNSEYVTIIFSKSDESHLSVVVGKKVAKLAVGRNKIRRRIYNGLFHGLKSKTGDFIVIVKPTFSKQTKQQQNTTILSLLADIEKMS